MPLSRASGRLSAHMYTVGTKVEVLWPLEDGSSSMCTATIARLKTKKDKPVKYLLEWDDGSPSMWSKLRVQHTIVSHRKEVKEEKAKPKKRMRKDREEKSHEEKAKKKVRTEDTAENQPATSYPTRFAGLGASVDLTRGIDTTHPQFEHVMQTSYKGFVYERSEDQPASLHAAFARVFEARIA